MAEELGSKLGEWLYHRGNIKEAQIDIVRYAFEILCSEFVELAVIIMYGIGSGKWMETLMFVGMLMIVRKIFQGYHAKTILHCFMITMGAYLITMVLFPYIRLGVGILFLCVSALLELDDCMKKNCKTYDCNNTITYTNRFTVCYSFLCKCNTDLTYSRTDNCHIIDSGKEKFMKDKLITLVAATLVKVGVAYDGNASPIGWYQPKKVKKDK